MVEDESLSSEAKTICVCKKNYFKLLHYKSLLTVNWHMSPCLTQILKLKKWRYLCFHMISLRYAKHWH